VEEKHCNVFQNIEIHKQEKQLKIGIHAFVESALEHSTKIQAQQKHDLEL
jgi:hypothetical protein